jgi:hypothetical protein
MKETQHVSAHKTHNELDGEYRKMNKIKISQALFCAVLYAFADAHKKTSSMTPAQKNDIERDSFTPCVTYFSELFFKKEVCKIASECNLIEDFDSFEMDKISEIEKIKDRLMDVILEGFFSGDLKRWEKLFYSLLSDLPKKRMVGIVRYVGRDDILNVKNGEVGSILEFDEIKKIYEVYFEKEDGAITLQLSPDVLEQVDLWGTAT